MSDKGYLERQSHAMLEEIDNVLYATDEYDQLLLKARWEIARLQEIVYDQTIELGLKDYEITQLKESKQLG